MKEKIIKFKKDRTAQKCICEEESINTEEYFKDKTP
jgi:hypothetical protein